MNNKPSLRERDPEFFIFSKQVNFYAYLKKRVSSFISVGFLKAGMTIEAAFILPFFFFAMISLVSVMDVMKIKGCVDLAVAEVGNELAIKSYSGNQGNFITAFYIKRKVEDFLEENLAYQDFCKISGDLNIKKIQISEENNTISFKIDYKVKPDFDMFGFLKINLKAQYYGHTWLGYKSQKETEKMVFLSSNASVYHLDKNCKYLNVTIIEIPVLNVAKYRNNSGEKYKDCNFCNDLDIGSIVYITPEGNNYHTIKNCIGLTRSVYTVTKEHMKGKRVCTGCGN